MRKILLYYFRGDGGSSVRRFYKLKLASQRAVVTQKILLTIGLVLCYSLNGLAAPRATGTIIVYNKMSGSMPFRLNNGPKIKVRSGHYYRLEMSPGDHMLSGPGGMWGVYGPLSDHQKVHVEPGQTIYFADYSVPFIGQIFEVAEDQNDARDSVSKLRAQN